MKLTIALLLLSWSPAVMGVVKTWRRSTSLETETNWSPNRSAICRQDRLVFGASAVSSMSSSLAFKEMILPLNGEIILNEGTALETELDSSCSGSEYTFKADKKHHWWHPNNWVHTPPHLLVGRGRSEVTSLPEVQPEADRVPCPVDDAVIPNGTAVRMILEGTAIVRTLTVNGQRMDSPGWSSFTSSRDGRRQVEGGGRIRVTEERDCSDPKGCVCGNAENQEILYQICEAVGPCPVTPCTDPILPDGFCCPICCSVGNFEYEENFQLDPLTAKFKELLKQNPVVCYVSRRRAGLVQAVCRDQVDGRNAHARAVVERAASIVIQDRSLHVIRTEPISSREWVSEIPPSSNSVGVALGIIFLVLFLSAGAAAAYYYYRKRRLPNLDFVRFDRGVVKMEVELGTTPHEALQPQEDPSASSASRRVFYNPVYAKEQPLVEKMPDTRENPIYGLDEAMEA